MGSDRPFRDRRDAGGQLAARLAGLARRADVLVLGLPRGGVPVAYEVARALVAPLDVFVIRKLGVPGHEELAMGAIASGGVRVVNAPVLDDLRIPGDVLERVAEAEGRELARREGLYRGGRGPLDVAGRTVVVVDDGLATGATMRAAVQALRAMGPAAVVVAVPVAAPVVRDAFVPLADEVICVLAPEPFLAVGLWYDDFSPTEDDEVRDLLARAAAPAGASTAPEPTGAAR